MKKLRFLPVIILTAALSACNFDMFFGSSSEEQPSSQEQSSLEDSSVTTQSSSEDITPSNKVIKQTTADYARYSAYNDVSGNRYGFDICPLEGNPKLLIIPVWFTDSSSYISTDKKENVREDIQKAYLGTNEETGWRSVKTFYEEESGGKLHLDGVVTPWYECGVSSRNATDSRTDRIVEGAVNWYFNRLALS